MLRVGLGFTGLGAAIGLALAFTEWSSFPFDFRLFGIAISVAGFGVAGFAPLLLTFATRPGRYLVTLRIEPGGFSVADSTGKISAFPWSTSELTITLIESQSNSPAENRPAQDLLVTPGPVLGSVSADAGSALLEAARDHNFVLTDDTYLRGGRQVGARSQPVQIHSAVSPTSSLLVLQSDLAETLPGTAVDLPHTFDVSTVPLPVYEQGPPIKTNGIRQVTVRTEGIDVVDSKGRSHSHSWGQAGFRLRMFRRLVSPLDKLRRPSSTWHLDVGSPRVQGYIDGECYGTIIDAARGGGLEERSQRYPGFQKTPRYWLAETSMERPRG